MANLFTKIDNSNSNYQKPDVHQDQLKFETEMKDFIPKLVSIIEEAHENMLSDVNSKHPDFLSHLSKSVRMHEQIKGLINETYGINVKKLKYNRFGLFIGNFVLLFKKLDDFGRPSNIKTHNTTMLLMNGKLNFPGEPIIVHVGYVVGRTWEEIRKIYAVGIVDNQVEWISNLQAVANEATKSVVMTPPSSVKDDDLVVTPKNKQRSAENGS